MKCPPGHVRGLSSRYSRRGAWKFCVRSFKSTASTTVVLSALMKWLMRGLVVCVSRSTWSTSASSPKASPNAMVNWFKPAPSTSATSARRISEAAPVAAKPPHTTRSREFPEGWKNPRAGAPVATSAAKRSANSRMLCCASRVPRPARGRGFWALRRARTRSVTSGVSEIRGAAGM